MNISSFLPFVFQAMEKSFQSGEVSIHYLDSPGPGPVFILLPGLTANCHIFDSLCVNGLAGCGHAVAVDLRGRGQSDQPASGYSLASHANDVRHLLKLFSDRDVVLVGHSFGGLVSAWLCAHYPELCSRLVLLDVAVESTDPKVVEILKPSLSRLATEFPSERDYLEKMRQAPYLAGYWDEYLEAYYRADMKATAAETVRACSTPEIIGACIDAVLVEDWPVIFGSLQTKTLLINASDDYSPAGPFVPAGQARRTAQLIPDCTYVPVPGNHVTMLFGGNAVKTATAISAWMG